MIEQDMQKTRGEPGTKAEEIEINGRKDQDPARGCKEEGTRKGNQPQSYKG